MVFKPAPDRSRWEGLLALFWLVVLDLICLGLLLTRPIDWIGYGLVWVLVLSMPLLAHLAYRTWGAWNLEYWINRDALRIRWADTVETIPLAAIRAVHTGGEASQGRNWRAWPGPHVRSSTDRPDLRMVHYATRPPAECLWVETETAVFAISPRHPRRFIQALEEYRRLGPAHQLAPGRTRLWPVPAHLWRQPGVRPLLLSGLVGGLVLLGVFMVSYPALPERMLFRAAGDTMDVVRPKSSLLVLPAMGWLAYLVNGLFGLWMALRGHWVGAYMLWGGTLVVQLMALVALVRFL